MPPLDACAAPSPARAIGRLSFAFAIALLLSLPSCRGDEQPVTGEPFVCTCTFDPDVSEDTTSFTVCMPTAGEAIDRAAACAEENGLTPPWFCDCEKDVVAFCDLGACAALRP